MMNGIPQYQKIAFFQEHVAVTKAKSRDGE